jgi:hypothetical protein
MLKPHQVHLQSEQVLPQLVMQFSSEPPSLLFAHLFARPDGLGRPTRLSNRPIVNATG